MLTHLHRFNDAADVNSWDTSKGGAQMNPFLTTVVIHMTPMIVMKNLIVTTVLPIITPTTRISTKAISGFFCPSYWVTYLKESYRLNSIFAANHQFNVQQIQQPVPPPPSPESTFCFLSNKFSFSSSTFVCVLIQWTTSSCRHLILWHQSHQRFGI